MIRKPAVSLLVNIQMHLPVKKRWICLSARTRKPATEFQSLTWESDGYTLVYHDHKKKELKKAHKKRQTSKKPAVMQCAATLQHSAPDSRSQRSAQHTDPVSVGLQQEAREGGELSSQLAGAGDPQPVSRSQVQHGSAGGHVPFQ